DRSLNTVDKYHGVGIPCECTDTPDPKIRVIEPWISTALNGNNSRHHPRKVITQGPAWRYLKFGRFDVGDRTHNRRFLLRAEAYCDYFFHGALLVFRHDINSRQRACIYFLDNKTHARED